MTELLTYSKFYRKEEAESFTALLKEANIHFEVEYGKNVLDNIYIGQTTEPLIAVRIVPSDFETVNKIMLKQAEAQLDDVAPDYYLFDFTNEELINVVNNKEEWNFFDQALAKKILAENKVPIPAPANLITEDIIHTPIHLNNIIILIEYVFSILFNFVGIVIGLATIFAFKTLKNGLKVKIYDEETRNHGKVMIAISIVRTFGLMLYLVLRS